MGRRWRTEGSRTEEVEPGSSLLRVVRRLAAVGVDARPEQRETVATSLVARQG